MQAVNPVNLNPQVLEPVRRLLDAIEDVHLIEPLDYPPFVYLMDKSTLILTDSGGIQEEEPSRGKPVLTMRDTTERPETCTLPNDPQAYGTMVFGHNPCGDGHACRRIAQAMLTG